jgi:hypothetical protein
LVWLCRRGATGSTIGLKEILMRFSRFTVLSVLAVGALTLAGCACDDCAKSESKASAGMVGGKKDCTEGSACCKEGAKASMGAVSEKKAGSCGAAKAECTAPATTSN